MILIALGLGILCGVGLIALALHIGARSPRLGVLVTGLLLALCLLSCELLLRVGFQYDLVRGHAPLPSFDGAPIMPAIGAAILLAAGASVITFIAAMTLLLRIWSKIRPRPLMLAALAPPLLVLAFQYLNAASDAALRNAEIAQKTERDDRAGFEWAAHNHIARESACAGHSAAYISGCRRYVQLRAGANEETLAHAGSSWAGRHYLQFEADCLSSPRPDFDDHPSFVAGCKEAVLKLNHGRGEAWAREHKIVNESDCRPGAEGFLDNPEFVAGCRSGAAEVLRATGANWAHSHYIFAIEDCNSALEAKNSSGFRAGCEGVVRTASKSRNIAWGIRWAYQNHINEIADCHGRVAHAPPEFEVGCEQAVRDRERIRSH